MLDEREGRADPRALHRGAGWPPLAGGLGHHPGRVCAHDRRVGTRPCGRCFGQLSAQEGGRGTHRSVAGRRRDAAAARSPRARPHGRGGRRRTGAERIRDRAKRRRAFRSTPRARRPALAGGDRRPLRRPRAGREPATAGRDRGCAGGEPRRRGGGHVARLAGGSRSGRALYRGGRAAVPRHPERRPGIGGARPARGGDAGRPLCGRARRRPSQDRGCAEPADPRIARRRRPRACARDRGSARRCRAA